MGDSTPNDRRRYARPGEFEIPSSVLETNSFKERFGGELNGERKSAAAVSRELPPNGNATLIPAKPGLPAVEAPLRPNPNQYGRNPIPASRELRPAGVSSHGHANPNPIHASPNPTKVEARLQTDLRQRASAVTVSPEARFSGELNPIRGNLMPTASEARLRVDLNQHRRNPAPLVKRNAMVSQAMVSRRVAARFELLPEPQSRWNRIGVSAVGQLAFLGFLLLSPMIFPQQMETALKFQDVVELLPVTHIEIPPATPPPPPPKPKMQPREPKPIVPKPKPMEVEPPKLNPQQPHVFLVLKPQLPKAHTVDVAAVDLKPIFAQTEIVLTTKQPKRPKEELKAPILQPTRAKADIQAPSLGLGSLPATVLAAANKVQTGGFGDPHGVRGPADPSKAGNINRAGSPNLPGGPGYGNGTGGAQGARGTVASTEGPKGSGAATGAATGGVTRGVDILSEPNPNYSTEARTLRLEGDVVLEVVFLASGQMQVLRIVSGLGHGLDEAAIQAAKLIRFRPAQRNGQPVDFHAHVRIEFRLAN